MLLDRGAAIDAADQGGATALELASIMNRGEVAALLLERGATVDPRDQTGRTPTMEAAFVEQQLDDRRVPIEVIDLLIERGAQVDLPDSHGYTPFLVAATKGHVEAARALARRGADVHRESGTGESALTLARAAGNPKLVEYLQQTGQ